MLESREIGPPPYSDRCFLASWSALLLLHSVVGFAAASAAVGVLKGTDSTIRCCTYA